MKNCLGVVLLSLLGFTFAQNMAARRLVWDFARAKGDLEAIANLVTDDFLLTEPDGTVYPGKAGVEAWTKGLTARNLHVEGGNIHARGDLVSFDYSASIDLFRQANLGALNGTAEAVSAAGKFKAFSNDPYAELRLEAAVAEVNKAIVKPFYDAVNAKNVDAFDGFVAADFVDHNPYPEQAPGLAGLKDAIQGFILAIPDLNAMQNAGVTATGDEVYVSHDFSGTHGGDFFGIPATNKAVQAHAIDIWTVRNGMITEVTHVEEIFQILAQLGAFE